METVELRDLLVAARVGDQHAWDTLVERFVPLVLSIARRFRLSEKDVEDVSQSVCGEPERHPGTACAAGLDLHNDEA